MTAGEHQARRLEHPMSTARVDRLAAELARREGLAVTMGHIARARRALASVGGSPPALYLVR